MTLGALSLGYVAIGAGLGAWIALRRRSALDALLAILAWPLLLPTLGSAPPPADEPTRMADDVRQALASVREAAAGSPFASLLGPDAEARLCRDLDRTAARMRAIDAELRRASRASGSTASLHADSEASLRALASADRAAMRELVELLGALRARIVLARHAGSPSDGPAALASELWARIEGLGEAVACVEAPPSDARR